MEAINEEARNYDMTTAIATAKNFELLLENVQRMHLQKQVDGFILVYSDSQDTVIDYLYQNHIPFTLIGQPYHHENEIVYVDNDNQLLGKQATEFLIQNGHKNILFVTNTTHESLYFERYFGYQKAMMMAGLPALSSVVLEHPEDYLSFEKTLKKTKPQHWWSLTISSPFARCSWRKCMAMSFQRHSPSLASTTPSSQH